MFQEPHHMRLFKGCLIHFLKPHYPTQHQLMQQELLALQGSRAIEMARHIV